MRGSHLAHPLLEFKPDRASLSEDGLSDFLVNKHSDGFARSEPVNTELTFPLLEAVTDFRHGELGSHVVEVESGRPILSGLKPGVAAVHLYSLREQETWDVRVRGEGDSNAAGWWFVERFCLEEVVRSDTRQDSALALSHGREVDNWRASRVCGVLDQLRELLLHLGEERKLLPHRAQQADRVWDELRLGGVVSRDVESISECFVPECSLATVITHQSGGGCTCAALNGRVASTAGAVQRNRVAADGVCG